jgi:hypothetical protein
MDKIPSGNLQSHTIIRLVGERRVLNTLPLSFSVSSWVAKKIGTVDPQGPWEYLDRRFFYVQGVVEECTGRNQSDLLDLDWKTR